MPPDIRSFFGGKGGQGAGSSQEQSTSKQAAVSIDYLITTRHCCRFGRRDWWIATIECFLITLLGALTFQPSFYSFSLESWGVHANVAFARP